MSNPKGTRRAIAEISWERDPSAVVWVGDRPVYSSWPLISAYFRDLLLPPHRHAADVSVTWGWHEPINPKALTASEIQSVRRRLESETQLFIEKASRGRPREASGTPNDVDPERLSAVLREWVKQVVARSDIEFATYLCRTDQGLRLHSWGAAKAAAVRFSDAKALELAGHVLVGGMPALHDVLLETGDGEMLAETPTDTLGSFRFPNLAPGKYRLRARSKRGTFPPNGVVVVLNQTSVVDAVLADDGPVATPTRGRRATRQGNRRKLIIATVTTLILGAGAWVTFDRNKSLDTLVTVAKGGSAAGVSAGRSPTDGAVAPAKAPTSSVISNQPTKIVPDPAPSLAPPPAVRMSATPVTELQTTPLPVQKSTPVESTNPVATAVASSAQSAVGSIPTSAESKPQVAAGPGSEPAIATVSTGDAVNRVIAATTRTEPLAKPDDSTAAATSTLPATASPSVSEVDGTQAATAVGLLDAVPVVATPRDVRPADSAPLQPARNASESNANSQVASVAAPALRMSSARLTRTVRVRLAPWRVRLMEDSILPTQPLRAGQAEPVATLRQQILAEQKAKLPATLTQSEVLSGLRVQIAPGDLTDGLAWRDEQGVVIMGSRVENGQAEITWAAADAPVDQPVRLSGRNGLVLAEARYEPQTRELVVRTSEATQAWLRWIIRAVPGDASKVPVGEAAGAKARFAWRTGAGDPVPTGWHASDAIDAAVDHRVDLPLGSVFGSVAAQSCALLDHASGWALVTEIRQAADRPLGL